MCGLHNYQERSAGNLGAQRCNAAKIDFCAKKMQKITEMISPKIDFLVFAPINYFNNHIIGTISCGLQTYEVSGEGHSLAKKPVQAHSDHQPCPPGPGGQLMSYG